MSQVRRNAAIRFEVEAFNVAKPLVMGRQFASFGFLRAAVEARGDQPVIGYGPSAATGENFKAMIQQLQPAAPVRWLMSNNLAGFAQVGLCYRSDPVLAPEARVRLRAGPAAYSLCGTTHSLSTAVVDEIAAYLASPVMPWDALVCTSKVAHDVVDRVLTQQQDYLSWRFPEAPRIERLQTPIIPLGVHLEDFAFSNAERAEARSALGLAEDEVAVLFAGRLSIADKAHPFAMYRALQLAAERREAKVVLVLAGQFLNDHSEEAIRSALELVCPRIRPVFVDGKDSQAFRQSWAGADIFLSLADSIQETFGLTPVEAMAAGLPVVVSDWNGYRDTVRDGVDGFRIRTWSPPPGTTDLGLHFETGVANAGLLAWNTTTTTSIDVRQAAERLGALIDDPTLRRRLGEAGRARARDYDWRAVYRRYQALWEELDTRRAVGLAALKDRPAPRASAGRDDPFAVFQTFPTSHIRPQVEVRLAPDARIETFHAYAAHAMFHRTHTDAPLVAAIWARLESGPALQKELQAVVMEHGASSAKATMVVGVLAKMDLVILQAGSGGT